MHPVRTSIVAMTVTLTSAMPQSARADGPFALTFQSAIFGGDNNLYEVNLSNGATSALGLMDALNLEGMALLPDGRILGIDANIDDVWNITPPPGSLIGTTGPRFGVDAGLAYDPISGKLYNLSGAETFDISHSWLYEINPDTGAATFVGEDSNIYADSLAINNQGQAFAADNVFTDRFFSVNLTTGHLTVIGLLGTPDASQVALSFDTSGTLWALAGSLAGAAIYTINPQTGHATFVTNMPNINGRWSGLLVIPGGDFTAPAPAPTIASLEVTETSVTMTSTVATDAESPPVEYFFDANNSQGSTDSGWQLETTYVDRGLIPSTGYVYRVKARDQIHNETPLSNFTVAWTLAAIPGQPALSGQTETTIDIDPDPGANPSFVPLAIRCTATNPNDPTWQDSYVDAAGNPSPAPVWRSDDQWSTITLIGAQPDTQYTFAVKARNLVAVETAFGPEAAISTLPAVPECALPGDLNQDGQLNGLDVAGFLRAKLSLPPAPGENPDCADFGNGDVTQDTADFVAVLLG